MSGPAPPPGTEPRVVVPQELLIEAKEYIRRLAWIPAAGRRLGDRSKEESSLIRRLNAALAAPPPGTEPTVTVPRQLLEAATRELQEWIKGADEEDLGAESSRGVFFDLRAALAAPQPAELRIPSYEEFFPNPPEFTETDSQPAEPEEAELTYKEICNLLGSDTIPPEKLTVNSAKCEESAQDAETEAIAYRVLARLLRESDWRHAECLLGSELEPEKSDFLSPPETAANITAGPKLSDGSPFCDAPNCPGRPLSSPQWTYSGRSDWRHAECLLGSELEPEKSDFLSDLERDTPQPGDLASLLHELLHDANAAMTAGRDLEAAETIALMHVVTARCPTLAAIDDTIGFFRRAADRLETELAKLQLTRVAPEEMP